MSSAHRRSPRAGAMGRRRTPPGPTLARATASGDVSSRTAHLLCPVRLDVTAQAAQRAEDLHIVLVVRAELHAVRFRDGERQLEDVDRIEAEPIAVQRR